MALYYFDEVLAGGKPAVTNRKGRNADPHTKAVQKRDFNIITCEEVDKLDEALFKSIKQSGNDGEKQFVEMRRRHYNQPTTAAPYALHGLEVNMDAPAVNLPTHHRGKGRGATAHWQQPRKLPILC